MNAAVILAITDIANDAGFTSLFNEETGLFTFTEKDCGIDITAVLQGEEDAETRILYNQIAVGTLSQQQVEDNYNEIIDMLIGATNGISTSSFQTVRKDDGSLTVLLNNYAPIQTLEEDDRMDITFVLQSMIADLAGAMDMLSVYMAEPKAAAAS